MMRVFRLAMCCAVLMPLLAACDFEVPAVEPLGQKTSGAALEAPVAEAATVEPAVANAVEPAGPDEVLRANGFDEVDISQVSGLPDKRYTTFIMGKARALAESELEKFSRIDRQYKDEVGFYRNIDHPVAPDTGIYLKWYREFTGYEVLDVLRSPSFLEPLIVEIRFDYTFVHTYMWTTFHADSYRDVDPLKRAREETEFSAAGTYSVIRRYPCDRYGEYQGAALPELPSRDTFPSPSRPVLVEGWSPLDGAGSPRIAVAATPAGPGSPAAQAAVSAAVEQTSTAVSASPGVGMPSGPVLTPTPPLGLPGAPPAARPPDGRPQTLDQLLRDVEGESEAEPVTNPVGLQGEIELTPQNLEALRRMVEDAARNVQPAEQPEEKKPEESPPPG